jgi:hypothetical protein
VAKKEFSKVSGLRYAVPEDMWALILGATRDSFISPIVAANVLGSEGGFKSHAKSPTGATGISQFTSDTFLETVFLNKSKLSPAYRKIIEDNMVAHNTAKAGHKPVYEYRIKPGGNENAVLDLRNNPEVAIPMGIKHMEWIAINGWKLYQKRLDAKINHIEMTYPHPLPTERLRILREHSKRPMTAADLKTFYVCGIGGGSEMLASDAEKTITTTQKASDYTKKYVVDNNLPMFKKEVLIPDLKAEHNHKAHNPDNKKDTHFKTQLVDRNVAEFMVYVKGLVGEDKIAVQSPAMTVAQKADGPIMNKDGSISLTIR